MSITEAQRLNRKNHLGSSDIPAILGLSPWATPADIWYFKTGRIPHDPQETPSEVQKIGNALEPTILEYYRTEGNYGDYTRDPEIAIPDTPIVVHIDAVENDSGNPIEVKTVNVKRFANTDDWGESGSSEVSKYACIQAHAHMLATDRELCYVPTFIGGRGFAIFYVERDEKLMEIIKEAALKFWHEYVLKDTPPPESIPSLDVIKKIRRVEGKPVKLENVLIDRWLSAKEIAKETAQIVIDFQAKILAALDGHAEGIYSDEGVPMMITNYEQSRKAHEVQASTFRVIRLKKVAK